MMNPLVERLYRKLTHKFPDKRTSCDCCGLSATKVTDDLVKHMKDCELAKLYESEGGAVEYGSR